MKQMKNSERIINESKKISVGDKLLVNNRKREIEVIEEYEYYKNNHEIQKFYILEDSGSQYLFVVYQSTEPFLYTESNFDLNTAEWLEGDDFTTEPKSSERVRLLFINSDGYCGDCQCTKLYDSQEKSYYCPMCLS